MSGSILHSRAGGIHPGAFVQSATPDTTDVQDGVLWIDTSTGPPYQLKRWNASAAAWHPVQMDTSGYPLPDGSRLEIKPDTTIGVPDPTEPPDISLVIAAGSGSGSVGGDPHAPWPAGTYYFTYTDVVAGGETVAAPVRAATLDGSTRPRMTRPPFIDFVPAGYVGTYAYLVGPIPPGTGAYVGRLSESYLSAINSWGWGVHGTEVPPARALRLLTKDGVTAWEHDGRTMRIKSAGLDKIVSPLPTLTGAPAMLVGQDASSGVLALCPEPLLPRARADILTAPPVPTTTVDLCTQLRCGVADACTSHLVSLYANWARWLSPLFALLGTLAVAAFIEEILPMLLAEEASASTLAVWQEFKPEIQGIIGVFTGNLLPLPTSDTTAAIQKMLFCQLVCEEGIVRPTAAQINGWRDAFLVYPDWAISSLQGQLLELLTKFTPLEDWLIAAEGATTSSACDGWTCP